MPRLCAVYMCNNVGKHLFPKNETLRAQWVKALRLDERRKIGWNLRKTSAICSDHFKDSDFTIIPPLFDGDQGSRKLKANAVPSILPWMNATVSSVTQNTTLNHDVLPESILNSFSEEQNTEFDHAVSKDYTRTEKSIAYVEVIPLPSPESELTAQATDPLKLTSYDEFIEDISQDAFPSVSVESKKVYDNSSFISNECEQTPESEVKKDVHVQTNDESPAFDLHKYKHSAKAIHFYTGLENYSKFIFVFSTLGDIVNNLKYFYGTPPKTIDPLQQFFMTLMILRQHKTFEEISMMYLISLKQITNIFITWVRFMALQWRKIDMWIDKPTVKVFMPMSFKDKYPNTRIVIDATECPIKKPRLPKAQQITFSTYKNRNTVKFLLGIAPSGLITYVSPCYGGSASDRQIIERSNILHRFDYNDEIMVDKGLNVQDIFLPYGVKVNMPAFFKKGSQINENTLRENRKVASERVHVERVIGLLKTYKILTQPMNRTETLLSSNIVFICAMLVNFRSNIVSR